MLFCPSSRSSRHHHHHHHHHHPIMLFATFHTRMPSYWLFLAVTLGSHCSFFVNAQRGGGGGGSSGGGSSGGGGGGCGGCGSSSSSGGGGGGSSDGGGTVIAVIFGILGGIAGLFFLFGICGMFCQAGASGGSSTPMSSSSLRVPLHPHKLAPLKLRLLRSSSSTSSSTPSTGASQQRELLLMSPLGLKIPPGMITQDAFPCCSVCKLRKPILYYCPVCAETVKKERGNRGLASSSSLSSSPSPSSSSSTPLPPPPGIAAAQFYDIRNPVAVSTVSSVTTPTTSSSSSSTSVVPVSTTSDYVECMYCYFERVALLRGRRHVFGQITVPVLSGKKRTTTSPTGQPQQQPPSSSSASSSSSSSPGEMKFTFFRPPNIPILEDEKTTKISIAPFQSTSPYPYNTGYRCVIDRMIFTEYGLSLQFRALVPNGSTTHLGDLQDPEQSRLFIDDHRFVCPYVEFAEDKPSIRICGWMHFQLPREVEVKNGGSSSSSGSSSNSSSAYSTTSTSSSSVERWPENVTDSSMRKVNFVYGEAGRDSYNPATLCYLHDDFLKSKKLLKFAWARALSGKGSGTDEEEVEEEEDDEEETSSETATGTSALIPHSLSSGTGTLPGMPFLPPPPAYSSFSIITSSSSSLVKRTPDGLLTDSVGSDYNDNNGRRRLDDSDDPQGVIGGIGVRASSSRVPTTVVVVGGGGGGMSQSNPSSFAPTSIGLLREGVYQSPPPSSSSSSATSMTGNVTIVEIQGNPLV